jgi:cation:H+ antiporter
LHEHSGLNLLLVVVGIGLLLAGGTGLVSGASALAARAGVSPLLVGLTVVAFGTSAPELMVTVLGALEGHSSLAFGNVVGSNIANLALVLGFSALITPVVIQGQLIRREVPLLLLGTAVLVVVSMDGVLRGSERLLDRSDALVLVLLFCIFIYVTVADVLKRREDPLVTEAEMVPVSGAAWSLRRDLAFLLGGTVALGVGGHLTVAYGAALAESLGVSQVVVGLFIVAVGTSMPELVTSVIAARRGQSDLCVGNVVGSNLMNGLLILPLGAALAPIEVPPLGLADLMVSLVLTAALIPVFIIGRSRLGRPLGIVFLLAYVGYLAFRAGLS